MKTVAFIIYDNFEELEAVAPIDILRRANVDVKILTLSNSLETTGRSNIKIIADAFLKDFKDTLFDCIAISGGSGFKEAIKSELLLQTIRNHNSSNKIIAAICAAPLILKEAGILENKVVTSHPSVFEKMGEKAVVKNLVKDGSIITSRGAGTAVEFGLEILNSLLLNEESLRISESICYKG